MAVDVSETTFDELLTTSEKAVVVDFWAPWCGPCRMIAPVLDELAQEHAGSMILAKVNVDDNPALASRYGVMGIPCVVRFDGGKETSRAIGVRPKQQLAQLLKLGA
ncbi:MAG: thioredoxin [Clostridia bacterium]